MAIWHIFKLCEFGPLLVKTGISVGLTSFRLAHPLFFWLKSDHFGRLTKASCPAALPQRSRATSSALALRCMAALWGVPGAMQGRWCRCCGRRRWGNVGARDLGTIEKTDYSIIKNGELTSKEWSQESNMWTLHNWETKGCWNSAYLLDFTSKHEDWSVKTVDWKRDETAEIRFSLTIKNGRSFNGVFGKT